MSTPSEVSRSPNGLTNSTPDDLLKDFPIQWQLKKLISRGTDFDRYRAADWTGTVVGTGTVAQINEVGGVLRLATSAGATDAVYLDRVGECYQFIAGLKAWFRSRFRVSDATNTELVAGLQITGTTPMAVSDGVYFHKPSAGTRLYLVQVSAATGATTTKDTGVDLVASAYVDAGFAYDGVGNIDWEILGTTGNIVARGKEAANLPTVTLTESLGVLNAAAAIHDFDIDYVFAAQQLNR